MRLMAILLVVVGAASCLLGELQGIPCARDGDCPTGYFCELASAEPTCHQQTNELSAPKLLVRNVIDPTGAVVADPFIERQGAQRLALIIENEGTMPATNVTAEFSELRCLNLILDDSDVADIIAGGSAEIGFTVTPDGTCGTPMITDWFLFFSGRGTRGTFNINIRAAPPGAN